MLASTAAVTRWKLNFTVKVLRGLTIKRVGVCFTTMGEGSLEVALSHEAVMPEPMASSPSSPVPSAAEHHHLEVYAFLAFILFY